MQTKRTASGLIFHHLETQEQAIIHTLLNQVMAGTAFGQILASRFADGSLETFYILNEEENRFQTSMEAAKADLNEEEAQGSHDEKVGSSESTRLIVGMIDALEKEDRG